MKICPACKKEYKEDIKFCPEDGTALIEASESEKSPPSGVTTGKILSGGDVNITNTTHHNVTNINQQDDSKKVMTCVVSGRQDVITQGSRCHTCGQWAHIEYYNSKTKECEKCSSKELEKKFSEYRGLFSECLLDDGKVDSDERAILDKEAKRLALSKKEIGEIESQIRAEKEIQLPLSKEEEIILEKSRSLLNKGCNFEEAFDALSHFKNHLHNPDIFSLFLKAAIAHAPNEALSVYQNNKLSRVDSPEKFFTHVCILEALGKQGDASKELKAGLVHFENDLKLKAKVLERLLNVYHEGESDESQLNELREFFKNNNFSEGKKDPYIDYVLRYFQVTNDQTDSVEEIISCNEVAYYARINPTINGFQKRLELKAKELIWQHPEKLDFRDPAVISEIINSSIHEKNLIKVGDKYFTGNGKSELFSGWALTQDQWGRNFALFYKGDKTAATFTLFKSGDIRVYLKNERRIYIGNDTYITKYKPNGDYFSQVVNGIQTIENGDGLYWRDANLTGERLREWKSVPAERKTNSPSLSYLVKRGREVEGTKKAGRELLPDNEDNLSFMPGASFYIFVSFFVVLIAFCFLNWIGFCGE